MAAVANIVLADAQVSPVNHTFIPLGPDTNGVWWFEDQSPSNVIGYNRISIQLIRTKSPTPTQASGSDRVNRVKIGLHCPVAETLGTNDAGVTPPPTLAYISRASIELILPERNSLQNRKDLRKFAQFVLADAQVIAMAETLQNIF